MAWFEYKGKLVKRLPEDVGLKYHHAHKARYSDTCPDMDTLLQSVLGGQDRDVF